MDIYDVTCKEDFARVSYLPVDIHRAIRALSDDAFILDGEGFGVAYAELQDGNAMITKWNREAYSNGVVPLVQASNLVRDMRAKYEDVLTDLMFMAKPD
jgi:hypothetical protein